MYYNVDMLKFHVFGNPLLEGDDLPVKILPRLTKKFPEIEFIHFDPNENLKPDRGRLFIIDTVANIDKAVLIDDLENLDTHRLYSPHDLDLAFNLKLLQKIGRLKRVHIIGVPPRIPEKQALDDISRLIRKIQKG